MCFSKQVASPARLCTTVKYNDELLRTVQIRQYIRVLLKI